MEEQERSKETTEQEKQTAKQSRDKSRIEQLAKPKPVPQGFLEDRRSVYWDNNLAKDWSNIQATTPALSERQAELCKSKSMHKDYVGDRPTPIWTVSEAAKSASATERVETLANPKSTPKDYEPCRQVQSIVSEAAQNATPSERIEMLAKSKSYAPLNIKPNSEWDWSEWESDLTEAAKLANCSERVSTLANPKAPHRSYKDARPVIWEVSDTAKKALPSLRVQQLARPKSRSQYNEDYDANAWKVSPGAKVAQATPRIAELAAPIPRKVRSKKVGVS
ncbi:testicular haploid expressed gene protein [Nematostella vectensis]|uniref:testicular haploid expressed gene protein n=1 Tax=Nematostella vectensis TaxID=45351 RepID=UPI00207717A2|nr:testicular haploid expressed gene protein [Nematostella vectensis]